jgi:hypothetical protein
MLNLIGPLLIVLLAACTTNRPASSSRGHQLGYRDVLEHVSAKPSGAKFGSRDGRWYGMDSDANITLKRNGRVEVTEFGYAVDTYDGTYSVDDTGAIHVSLRRYPAKWPSMYLYKDNRGAILIPTDRDQSFQVGGRAGAVVGSGMAPYWPFRQTN